MSGTLLDDILLSLGKRGDHGRVEETEDTATRLRYVRVEEQEMSKTRVVPGVTVGDKARFEQPPLGMGSVWDCHFPKIAAETTPTLRANTLGYV